MSSHIGRKPVRPTATQGSHERYTCDARAARHTRTDTDSGSGAPGWSVGHGVRVRARAAARLSHRRRRGRTRCAVTRVIARRQRRCTRRPRSSPPRRTPRMPCKLSTRLDLQAARDGQSTTEHRGGLRRRGDHARRRLQRAAIGLLLLRYERAPEPRQGLTTPSALGGRALMSAAEAASG